LINCFRKVRPRALGISLGVILSFGIAHAAAAAEELPREATLPGPKS